MKISRRFTKVGQDVYSAVEFEKRSSRISNPDGSVVFEMNDAMIPKAWSQLATDIMVSKYFRKAGVPQLDTDGNPKRDENGRVITGPEKSAAQVIHRLVGCWRHWGETHGYFDSTDDAQAFYDELAYMLLHQMCAPNSPQWFNTGLNWAYGITGPAQGHFYCDPKSGELKKGADAYTHPQPHACFIQSVSDDLVNPGGIMDLWTREARLFKYGSGTGSNFSRLRGENEPLSGGGKSSGLMSFLKIGDRAAGAIKSGGTTRRAAKMVCLDLDHPDIESFINWKVREELKVAALAEGAKHFTDEQKETAKKLGLKLDYDFNGESYMTVSGQNSNNSVRIPNEFFKAVENDGPWHLRNRTNGKIAKTIPARELWDEISYAAWRCADPGVQYDGTINQWHTCPQSGRINASNPCVTGDTRVLTPGGVWRRIDQMIHLPERVITNLADGDEANQSIHNTDGAFPTGTKDVYELRTAGGYSVKLTADHKVWTRSRGWQLAKDLLPSDEVRLPSLPATQDEIGEPTDPKFFELLGLFVSTNDPNSLSIEDPALLDYVTETWHPYNDDYVNTAMLTLHTSPSLHAGTERTRAVPAPLATTLSHPRLLARLKAFTRTESGSRRLSDDAFTAGLAAQKYLLRALFSAETTLDDHGLTLTVDSLPLLSDVQLILLGFGIRATVSSDPASLNTTRRHRLVIPPISLSAFQRHIGLFAGSKAFDLSVAIEGTIERTLVQHVDAHFDRVATLTPLGKQQVFDLTEPVTHSFIANGITVHNCSEYMFLDDTACNLASLNVLTFFDAESRRFDIEAFKHGIRLWTVVLEISVLMASFPSEEIAQLSYQFRTLGLGYANLGAMLMQAGIPYDSDKGRAVCAALSAVLTGESYATSADMARELGAFPGYAKNKQDMLRVMRNHKRAAYDVAKNAGSKRGLGDFESLDISPVGIDSSAFSDADTLISRQMLGAAQECWDRALFLGERHGYRNAQTTVIAPTGTIGLLMDCDTTGVEPDFALVKFKKLAGGGYFKIANQSLQPALQALGYSNEEIHDILQFVMGTLSLHGSPHINFETLRSRGLTEAELEKIEATLPSQFELSFAFTGWSLSSETMKRLGIENDEWQAPGFNLLRRLGFTRKQIDDASAVICGRGTVEGAPHLRDEHLPVFDCANRCGKTGQRFIAASGHIRMMAAAQPFISGAISKTINLPNEATIDEIKEAYHLSWKLGLKANALYRDGSKLSQPLNAKSDDVDELEDDDAENVAAAKEELADQLVTGVLTSVSTTDSTTGLNSDNLESAPLHTHVIERIVERIVERPLRRRLPDTRHAVTHKFDVAGHEGYITTGLYEDGQPGEIFIRMAKEGSTIGGLMDTIATLVSVSLQYGVPVESLVRKFEHVRFEPSGMSRNPEIPMAKSLVDYIFRYLAMEFVEGYREANAPKRPTKVTPPAPVTASAIAAQTTTHGVTTNGNGNGNGHSHPRLTTGSDSQATYTDAKLKAAHSTATSSRFALTSDPLSQQGTEMQQDAPACDVCGSITVRSGTCYKCMNCGSSMGCS